MLRIWWLPSLENFLVILPHHFFLCMGWVMKNGLGFQSFLYAIFTTTVMAISSNLNMRPIPWTLSSATLPLLMLGWYTTRHATKSITSPAAIRLIFIVFQCWSNLMLNMMVASSATFFEVITHILRKSIPLAGTRVERVDKLTHMLLAGTVMDIPSPVDGDPLSLDCP